MTHIDGFPLPATARHDEHGNHIPPHIPEWRANPGAGTISGRLVERNERQQAEFHAHLTEHRRRGESAVVVGDLEI